MSSSKLDVFFTTLSVLLVLIISFYTLNNSFFWDTIQLGSLHASFFYNNLDSFILPENIDSGHIPAFGYYLATIWKVFGRTLVVSHLAILPFSIGILWQLQQLTVFLFKKGNRGIVLFLIVIDPTLLSQMVVVSPDVPLVFFFILGVNSILRNNKISLFISIIFLFLISMRGMMVSLSLLFVDVFYNVSYTKDLKKIFVRLINRSIIYIPALTMFIGYYSYHYYTTGWSIMHNDSPWAESFEGVGVSGVIYNIGILYWRLLDFGRVIIWIILLIILIKYSKTFFKDKLIAFLLVLFVSVTSVLSLNMIWAVGLMGHRYLLPVYLSISLLTAYLLFQDIVDGKLRYVLLSLWGIILLTGNLWVYPDKISQGWDSTLAHIPYFELRHKSLEFIEENNIELNRVQSFFPNISIIDNIDLNNDMRSLQGFDGSGDYLMYSNIFNISDEEYDLIKTNFSLMKEFNSRGVFVRIYKKKE